MDSWKILQNSPCKIILEESKRDFLIRTRKKIKDSVKEYHNSQIYQKRKNENL